MPLLRWPPDLPGEDGGWAPLAALPRPKAPAAALPAPAPVLPIPDPEDPALLARKRREAEAALSRSGRLSTMLTDDNSYTGEKLGLR